MKLKILAFITIMAMSVGSPANAAYYTGGEILSDCESKSDANTVYCLMYLVGVADAHKTLSNWEISTEELFCIPDGVKQGQLRKVYVKYANENPQELHLAAGSMATNSFTQAFPCE
jgi:hypothetical protein